MNIKHNETARYVLQERDGEDDRGHAGHVRQHGA